MPETLDELKRKLEGKTKDELNVLGKKLQIRSYRQLNKLDLIESLLLEHQLVSKHLKLTWWDNYHGHVYGGFTFLGVILTVAFFFFPSSEIATKSFNKNASNDGQIRKEASTETMSLDDGLQFNAPTPHKIIPVESEDTERVYLAKRPKDMLEFLEGMKGMTRLQADLLVQKTYKDTWIRIHGPVADVLGSDSYAWLVFRIDGITTRVDLQTDQLARARLLQSGDIVTVDAQFKSIDDVGPDFRGGVFILSDDSN